MGIIARVDEGMLSATHRILEGRTSFFWDVRGLFDIILFILVQGYIKICPFVIFQYASTDQCKKEENHSFKDLIVEVQSDVFQRMVWVHKKSRDETSEFTPTTCWGGQGDHWLEHECSSLNLFYSHRKTCNSLIYILMTSLCEHPQT